jgi:ClpP class serine protease
MDSGIVLIDSQAFQSYAMRASQQMPMKLADMQRRVSAGMSDSEWFAPIKAYEEGGEFDRRGDVAVIKIRGFISYAYDFWSWIMDGCSYCGVMSKVTAAANDSSIRKIVLDCCSPGGSTIGCIEASNAIFAARKVKEVVAVINPEAASAAYWLASQAERIVAMESGWVGSVGAQSDYQSWAGWLKLGHRMEPISERATEYIQGLVDYAASSFIAHVARGRSIKEQEVLSKYGKGRMLFGSQALEVGMVDAIGSLADELLSPSGGAGSSSRAAMRRTRAAAASWRL